MQRVAMPASRVPSWTVLGDDDAPIEPIERYLAYLTDIERSPNTVKAYAHDLKDYWGFLAAGVRSVVHATLSPSSASGDVSPKRNHNRPSCSKDEPRSVPTSPNRVSVRL